MFGLLRKLRAALVTAVIWALTFSVWGLVVAIVGSVLDLQLPVPFRQFSILYMVYRCAIVGAAGGAFFALVLGVLYRHRELDKLRPTRVAAWGTLAGLLLPVAGGVITIEALGIQVTPARILTSALFFYVVPSLVTAYGTIRLAQGSTPRLATPATR